MSLIFVEGGSMLIIPYTFGDTIDGYLIQEGIREDNFLLINNSDSLYPNHNNFSIGSVYHNSEKYKLFHPAYQVMLKGENDLINNYNQFLSHSILGDINDNPFSCFMKDRLVQKDASFLVVDLSENNNLVAFKFTYLDKTNTYRSTEKFNLNRLNSEEYNKFMVWLGLSEGESLELDFIDYKGNFKQIVFMVNQFKLDYQFVGGGV